MKGRAKGLNRRRGLIKAFGSLGMLKLLEHGPEALLDNLRAAGEQAANSDRSDDFSDASHGEKSRSEWE